MKFFNLLILIIMALTASVAAQNVETLAPTAKISKSTFKKPEKILFQGSIKARSFEMTLVWDGDNFRGSYFFVKSGRASARAVRGKIEADGKVVLREFNRADTPTGEFRGELMEDSTDYDLVFDGDWNSGGANRKLLTFRAVGQIIGFTGEQHIETEYISEKSIRRRYEIDATYPQIVGRNAPGASGFNLLAKQSVVEPVAEFRKMTLRQTAEDIKSLRDEGNTLSVSTYIKFAGDRFISVIYFYSENSNGMPRSFDYAGTLNYDLENKRELKLVDLFKPGAKYLETISAYCLKILKSQPLVDGQKLVDSDWEKGVKADADNYDSWNLMKKGLLITFEEYQMPPFSAGLHSVLIPYSELKSIAKPGGGLAKMMK